MPEELKVPLPSGWTQEEFIEALQTFTIRSLVYKRLRKNLEYKKLLKDHREAVKEREAQINQAALLWSQIEKMRRDTYKALQEEYRRDKCPKCGRVAKTPQEHSPICPLMLLAKKNPDGSFATE